MSCQDPIGTDCHATGPTPYEAEQLQAERAVLVFVLDEHPSQLTIPELCRALYAKPGDFESNDVIERAVRDLVSCGLLNCEGPFVVPTKAARCYARLETT
jgi:hypothetical protein